jgi:hypothetical protein
MPACLLPCEDREWMVSGEDMLPVDLLAVNAVSEDFIAEIVGSGTGDVPRV